MSLRPFQLSHTVPHKFHGSFLLVTLPREPSQDLLSLSLLALRSSDPLALGWVPTSVPSFTPAAVWGERDRKEPSAWQVVRGKLGQAVHVLGDSPPSAASWSMEVSFRARWESEKWRGEVSGVKIPPPPNPIH